MKSFLRINFILLFVSAFISCRNSANDDTSVPPPPPPPPVPLTADELITEVKTFPIEGGGWGYDISVNDEPYIHQPNIPAINGNIPFKTEEDALKVADLVVQKIKGNVIPPSVTPEELAALGVTVE